MGSQEKDGSRRGAEARRAVGLMSFLAEIRPDAPRPADYPLPVHKSGYAYWDINFALISCKAGWREWQAKRDMKEIIPVIDRLRAFAPLREERDGSREGREGNKGAKEGEDFAGFAPSRASREPKKGGVA